MGLSVKADAHTVSIHDPQGSIVAQLVAVPDLVCRGRQKDIRVIKDSCPTPDNNV